MAVLAVGMDGLNGLAGRFIDRAVEAHVGLDHRRVLRLLRNEHRLDRFGL